MRLLKTYKYIHYIECDYRAKHPTLVNRKGMLDSDVRMRGREEVKKYETTQSVFM